MFLSGLCSPSVYCLFINPLSRWTSVCSPTSTGSCSAGSTNGSIWRWTTSDAWRTRRRRSWTRWPSGLNIKILSDTIIQMGSLLWSETRQQPQRMIGSLLLITWHGGRGHTMTSPFSGGAVYCGGNTKDLVSTELVTKGSNRSTRSELFKHIYCVLLIHW